MWKKEIARKKFNSQPCRLLWMMEPAIWHFVEGKRVVPKLKECAERIADTDRMMQEIRIQMEQIKSGPSDTDAIYQKLKQLDIAIG